MSFHVSTEEKVYHSKFSEGIKPLRAFLFYPDDLAFLYFSSGFFQVWDLLNDKLISDGLIEKELRFLSYFSRSEVAFYSLLNQSIKILNIFDRKEKKLAAKAPTDQALWGAGRSDQIVKTLYDEGTCFESLFEGGFLVLFEQKSNILNSNENVITVFNEDSDPFFYQTVYTNTVMKKLFLSLANHKDTIIVYGDEFHDRPLEFYVLNVNKKDSGFKVVTLHSSVTNFQILQVCGGKNKELIFFGNNNASPGFPFIIIVDYGEEKEIRYIELNHRIRGFEEKMMTNVYRVYREEEIGANVAVFAILHKIDNFLVIFDLDKNKMETHKMPQDEIKLVFSHFSPHFVHLEEEEKCVKMGSFSFKRSSILDKRLWLLYILERKKIVSTFGKWVTQEIINFLV